MQNIKNFEKGFTLIELLVVVAIVGLLAMMTFGYLGSARKKGNDTAVKSNLATVRTASEIFFLSNGSSYLPSTGFTLGLTTPCPSDYVGASGSNMFVADRAISDALTIAKSKGIESYCYNSANVWSVAIGLSMDSTTSWCVDSLPSAKLSSFVASSAIDPATNLCK